MILGPERVIERESFQCCQCHKVQWAFHTTFPIYLSLFVLFLDPRFLSDDSYL